ncbi:MAG: hypothetical protein EB164_08580, partial [Thaumarchaeota archaeon]|nr:hypothetical protein [Nitrososphaerota archaeon]
MFHQYRMILRLPSMISLEAKHILSCCMKIKFRIWAPMPRSSAKMKMMLGLSAARACGDASRRARIKILGSMGGTVFFQTGGKMHTARSRNDQVALDLRMKIRDDINTICSCILDMVETLILLAEKHTTTAMPLYTHLQQAQIGTFSHFLISYSDALLRDFERLYDTFERVNHSPLGAGPIGGTSLPINRNSTAKMLGFFAVVENSI